MLNKPVKTCKTCLKNPRHPGRTECSTCLMQKEYKKAREQKKRKEEREKIRKVKVKTKKALSRSSLIKEADRVWSLAIRERDRGKPCITCKQKWDEQIKLDAEYHIKHKCPEWDESNQAGHFMSRRHLNTRWVLANGAGQCPKCNCWGAGEQYEFALALEKKFPLLPEQLRRLALSTDKITDDEILGHIKILYNELASMAVDFKPKKIYI